MLKEIEKTTLLCFTKTHDFILPSIRYHSYLPYKRNDNNIFFSAITAYTLKNIAEYLPVGHRQIIQSIISGFRNEYHKYQHHTGIKTYNFWKTNGKHFPNGCFLSKIRKFKIPDDADVSSMVYLTSDFSDKEKTWYKDKLAKHANMEGGKVKNTYRKFRELKAYSTWFGTSKMPIEFDVCVHTNILLFVFENKLSLNQYDIATNEYPKSVINEKLYFKNPFKVACTYPKTPVILYHIARLFSKDYLDIFKSQRNLLINDLNVTLSVTNDAFDRMLLVISLLRIKGNSSLCSANFEFFNKKATHNFFTAGMLSTTHNRILRFFAPNQLFHIKFSCYGYTLALLCEFLCLRV